MRIALISATTAAIEPAMSALAEELPVADPWNILDDKLLSDAEKSGGITPSLEARMLYRRGLTHGSTGNLSIRAGGKILVTPTGVSLGYCCPATCP